MQLNKKGFKIYSWLHNTYWKSFNFQVFTAGFNDSVESDDKNDVGDLTWAPMDEDDFSDKSETMLDDDQSMSSVRTNHTFGCFT